MIGWTHEIVAVAANGLGGASAARTEFKGDDRRAIKPDLGARRGRGEAHVLIELLDERAVGPL